MDNDFIVTIEFRAADAHRLLWLLQKQALYPVYDEYWANLATHVQLSIIDDTPEVQHHEVIPTAH